MNLKDYPILYVDDDRTNRIVMKHNHGNSFKLLFAESGEQALEILSREYVAVLLSDQRMPGMTGVELVERVSVLYPDIVRVIITAYSNLEATVDAINRGRVSRFLKKPWTHGELALVMQESVQAFHQGLLAKEMQRRLVEFNRVTALGLMASGVAHDFRQPLAYIEPNLEYLQLELEALRTMVGSPDIEQRIIQMEHAVNDAISGAKSLRDISETLLDALRSKQRDVEIINLVDVAQGVAAVVHTAVLRQARFHVELPQEEVVVSGHSSQLSQLIINLLLNAAQAISPTDRQNNDVYLRIYEASDRAVIEVEDTGVGIPEDKKEIIFSMFYSTKPSEGVGIGLAVCRQIVEEHGGSIEVRSRPGAGTLFRVTFPRMNGSAVPPIVTTR